MKKLIIILFLVAITAAGNAQVFKTIKPFPTVAERKTMAMNGEKPINYKFEWRLDATISIAEAVWHTDTKDWSTEQVVGFGPAFGIQKYVPKSDTDPTPVNVYGASAAILMGNTTKIALQINLWQYFKFGGTWAPKPLENIGHFGLFFGGGITF